MLPGAEIVPCKTVVDVFNARFREVNVAVIPIENSLAGSVIEFYDAFHNYSNLLLNGYNLTAKILREHMHRIRHNLIARPGTGISEITQVLSHPIALAQCRIFFSEHHPNIQPVEHYDTAGSVKTIMQAGGDPSCAAIASKQAAEMYGGQILMEGIEDDPENYTRFFLFQFDAFAGGSGQFTSRISPNETPDKMSLFFSLKNRPGALVEALSIFSVLEMNLTKIESRPIKGRPWEYMFFVDVLFPKLEVADEALARLQPICETMIDLGRYKAAVLG